jgi:hypothetical protein
MTIPSNGITADVIRDLMPPYHLSADLLAATFITLPPPPADAAQAQRASRQGREGQGPGRMAQPAVVAGRGMRFSRKDPMNQRAGRQGREGGGLAGWHGRPLW